MNDFKKLAYLLPMLAVLPLVWLGSHCDPEKPIDVGIVEAVPCPEAAAPPAWTQPAYVVTPSELELLQMIDAYEPSEMSRTESDAWWRRYHALSDKAREERASQHPHTPP